MNTAIHHHYANERHHRAKLSDADVTLIRQLRRYGLPYHAIAEKFECGTSTVRDIIKQRTRPQPCNREVNP